MSWNIFASGGYSYIFENTYAMKVIEGGKILQHFIFIKANTLA